MFLAKKKSSPFPEKPDFSLSWRPYQTRVLQELKSHLDDDRLHVVAAPGAGKTVLGLEVVSRLNAPTVILSPTITIRDQWLDRLENLFLAPAEEKRDWISTDVLKPGRITSITYQSLHSALTGAEDGNSNQENEEEERAKGSRKGKAVDVAALLKGAGVNTMVLDECHHLRAEWWRALTKTVDSLNNPRIVALTATPPYDVPPQEWERYQKLCGPVDAEISVPELVSERNLCPHQDYVYLSAPSSSEKERIKAFRSETRDLLEGLLKKEDFLRAVESHPFLAEPKTYVKEILERITFFSSIAIFLYHARGRAPKKLLKVMGLHREKIPPMTEEWWEELLNGCLYRDRERLAGHDALLKEVERGLKRTGAVERRQVNLRSTNEIARLFASSLSKLESIRRIVKLEHDALGESLRQVVLTDYIRADDMPKGPEDEKPMMRIGVVPLFETLRSGGPEGIRLGILSGSLVVVPAAAVEDLRSSARNLGLDPAQINTRPLSHDDRFVRVTMAGADKKRLVRLVTEVFGRGAVTVLVGTKSLLGEGWDAPSVNSLVLASFVGSFMLSNQMRGRAIRVEPQNPEKTANIWHLACVEDERGPSGEPRPGPDWEIMTRRFKAFTGPSRMETVIENGINRLGLGKPPYSERGMKEINRRTEERALDRAGLRKQWEQALGRGKGNRMIQELEIPSIRLPRPYVYVDVVKALIQVGFFTAGHVMSLIRIDQAADAGIQALFVALAAVFGIGALVFLPFFLKALWLLLRHGSAAGSLKQIGKALLRAMVMCGAIETKRRKIRVVTMKGDYDTMFCRLEGGTTFEKSLFLEALEELFAPIDNPRYLLVRKSRLLMLTRKDYHAVPAVLGRRKEYAEFFSKMWKKFVGPVELVYTRNVEGREVLLKSRGQSLSAAFLRRSERRNRWR